jgi:hypothetical protein
MTSVLWRRLRAMFSLYCALCYLSDAAVMICAEPVAAARRKARECRERIQQQPERAGISPLPLAANAAVLASRLTVAGKRRAAPRLAMCSSKPTKFVIPHLLA